MTRSRSRPSKTGTRPPPQRLIRDLHAVLFDERPRRPNAFGVAQPGSHSAGHRWASGISVRLRPFSDPRACADVHAVGNPADAVLTFECNGRPWQQLNFTADGLLVTDDQECLDATRARPGERISIAACNAMAPEQRWQQLRD